MAAQGPQPAPGGAGVAQGRVTEPLPWMRRLLPGSLPSGRPLPSLASSPGLWLPFLQPPRRSPQGSLAPASTVHLAGSRESFPGLRGPQPEQREGEIPKEPWGEEGWEEEWCAKRWRTLLSDGSFSSPPTPPKAPPPGTQVWPISRRYCWLRVVVVRSLVFFIVKMEKGKLVAPTNNPQGGRDKSSPLPVLGEWGSDFLVSACLARLPTNSGVQAFWGNLTAPLPSLRFLWGPTCQVESQELAFE